MNDPFNYLKSYPEIYEIMKDITARIHAGDYSVAVQKMRTAAEFMLKRIYQTYTGSRAGMDLFDRIVKLGKAKILSSKSQENYHFIRKNGNNPSHDNTKYSENEIKRLYRALLEESVLFTEKYMVEIDPIAKRRLNKTDMSASTPVRDSNDSNILLSPAVARLIGAFQFLIAIFMLSYISQFSTEGAFMAFFYLVLIMFFGESVYTMITGDDRVLLFMMMSN